MIVDFIKSWLYYPKLKEYLKNNGLSVKVMFGDRLRYAKWYCQVVKLKDNQQDIETEKDKSDGWTSVYDREPIISKEVVTFEKPKYIDVDGRKVEVEEIIIGHTQAYRHSRKQDRICNDFKTKMWKLKEELPLDVSSNHLVNDDGEQYICYLSEHRKTLIECK